MQTSSLTGTFILVESCPLNRDFLLSAICRHKKSLVREPGSVGQKDHPHGRVGVMWGMLAVYFGMWCCWIFVGKWRQLVASILLTCWWRPQRIWPNYAKWPLNTIDITLLIHENDLQRTSLRIFKVSPRNSQGSRSTDGLQDCWEAHLKVCRLTTRITFWWCQTKDTKLEDVFFCAWDLNQGTLIFGKIVGRMFERVWRFLRSSQFQKHFAILPSTQQTTLTCWKIG